MGWEEEPRAQELLRRAARMDVAPPPGARARVWAQLVERRQRERERPARRRLGGVMFVAGAACAATLALMLALPWLRAQRSDPGELTIASSSEPALIELGSDGRVVAGPATRARLFRSARAVRLTLEQGSLLAHVRPRGKRAPFVVETAAFEARVVGTVLRVVARQDGSASIAVGHGTVEVTPRGQKPIVLHGGERWPSAAADAPSAGELLRMGAEDLEGADAASLSPLPQPAAPRAAAEPGCAEQHGEAGVQCWLAAADAAPDAARAEAALYRAGFLRMHELGDPAFALGIWERQRQRFPHGLLHDEAQTSIIDALVALKRTRAAEAEIADYLKLHPRGVHAAELHFVRGTLLRAQDGDCRRARRELDAALAQPAAPWAERARAERARCR